MERLIASNSHDLKLLRPTVVFISFVIMFMYSIDSLRRTMSVAAAPSVLTQLAVPEQRDAR